VFLVAFILYHAFIYKAYLEKDAGISKFYRIYYVNISKGKPRFKKYTLYPEIQYRHRAT